MQASSDRKWYSLVNGINALWPAVWGINVAISPWASLSFCQCILKISSDSSLSILLPWWGKSNREVLILLCHVSMIQGRRDEAGSWQASKRPQACKDLTMEGHSIIDNIAHTIAYPEIEHLAKPLHHAMKTALFPLFFYQVVRAHSVGVLWSKYHKTPV